MEKILLKKAIELKSQIDKMNLNLDDLKRIKVAFNLKSDTGMLLINLEWESEENKLLKNTLFDYCARKLRELEAQFKELK